VKIGVFHFIKFNMRNYIQLEFENIDEQITEVIIALLSDLNYEGFEESENNLKAFIKEVEFNEAELNKVLEPFNLQYSQSKIEETNWNQVWESNFDPIVIEDICAIRADFHEPITGVKNEIIITPKMSFGTGHHATTHMMIQMMDKLEFQDKLVFDFGTGTGILAIFAEKLGAEKIIAIDNDDWSIDNTIENNQRNQCVKIEVYLSEEIPSNTTFDIILANINKHVILASLQKLSQQLKAGGDLLISGFLPEDEDDIMAVAKDFNFFLKSKLLMGKWICLHLGSPNNDQGK
jgi:ribosomal protein L11 methyltransferase